MTYLADDTILKENEILHIKNFLYLHFGRWITSSSIRRNIQILN